MNKFDSKIKTVENTGVKRQIDNRLGVIRAMIVTPYDFDFDTVADALTLTNWQTAIKAIKGSRVYPIMNFVQFEDNSVDEVYSTDLTGEKFQKKMKLAFTASVDVNKAVSNYLRSHNYTKKRIFLIDESQSILCTSSDGTKVKGFTPSLFRVVGQKFAEADGKMLTQIKVSFLDSDEWNDEGVVLEPAFAASDWNPLQELDGLTNVDVSLVSATAESVTVRVHMTDIAEGNELGEIYGLVLDDFVQTRDGSAQVLTGAEDNGDGTYTLAGTIANDDVISLAASSSLSIMIEGVSSATVTGIA